MSENDLIGPGMTRQRYQHLSRNMEAKLTPEELNCGWHFCLEWDDMLIHESWPEAMGCSCRSQL